MTKDVDLQILEAPVFSDTEQNNISQMSNFASLTLIAIGVIWGVLFLTLHPQGEYSNLLVGVLIGIGLITQILVRLKQPKLSASTLIILAWFGISLFIYITGGGSSPLFIFYLIIVLFSGFLFSSKVVLFTTVISLLAIFGFSISTQSYQLYSIYLSTQNILVIYGIALILGSVFLIQFVTIERKNALNSKTNERKLALHNYELQQQQDMFSSLLTEQTLNLEHTNSFLNAITELSQLIKTHLSIDSLIQQAITLLQSHFNLYYAGVFLLDESEQWAVLQAGTGEIGKEMLARQHRIKIGSGMIGWSILNARQRVAANVSSDALHLPAYELPETQSEAAIPINVGGKIIGAITVQSTLIDYFDQKMLISLQSFADILGLAIKAFELSAQNKQLSEEQQKIWDIEDRETWQDSLGDHGIKGLLYDRTSITTTNMHSTPEMERARNTGKPLILLQNDSPTAYIPVQVRKVVIGVLVLRKPPNSEPWTEKDISLLTLLSDQLGQALENARIYQTIRQQASRDKLVSEVTNRMQETLDVDTVLRTAAEKIYQALQVEDLSIELDQKELQPLGSALSFK